MFRNPGANSTLQPLRDAVSDNKLGNFTVNPNSLSLRFDGNICTWSTSSAQTVLVRGPTTYDCIFLSVQNHAVVRKADGAIQQIAVIFKLSKIIWQLVRIPIIPDNTGSIYLKYWNRWFDSCQRAYNSCILHNYSNPFNNL